MIPNNCDIEFYPSKKGGSPPLVIAFGGMSSMIAMPVYEFKRFLQGHFDCHFMFVRDRHQCWYFKGVHGLGDSIDESVKTMYSIIEGIPHSKVITLGTSAGGYGALVFGSLLKVDTIMAFNPQTFLDSKTRRTMKEYKWDTYI